MLQNQSHFHDVGLLLDKIMKGVREVVGDIDTISQCWVIAGYYCKQS